MNDTIKVKDDSVEDKVKKILLGFGRGVHSIKATVNKVNILTELVLDDCEGNAEPASAVDTEVMGLINLVIHYNAGYSLSLEGVYTNHVMQGECFSLGDIEDEVNFSSFFFDLNHKLFGNEKNHISYSRANFEESSLGALIEANEILNKHHDNIDQLNYLQRSLNAQSGSEELLTDKQGDEISKSIRGQMAALLGNNLV